MCEAFLCCKRVGQLILSCLLFLVGQQQQLSGARELVEPMSLRSYLLPTSVILIVSFGSIYGANLKSQSQLSTITSRIQEPEAKLKELEQYREQLIAQRILQIRKYKKWQERVESVEQ